MTDPLEALQAELDVAIYGRALDPRLHDYQRQAVDHLTANPRAGLLLEMGLGKTASSLQALTPDHLPALVIAPKRVAEHVWPTEVPKWRPDLTIAVAAGSPAKRAKALASGADVVSIGRENVKDVKPRQFKTIIIDELSGYKNRGSARWKMTRKLTDKAEYVWGLTGTPSPNGLMDLWAQLFLLDKGQSLGKTLTGFRSRYFTPAARIANGIVTKWEPHPETKEKIEELIAPICLSMRAVDHLDLPPVTFNPVTIPLPPAAQKIYDRMAATLVAEIGPNTYTAANAAILTNRLAQITAGFLYADPDEPGDETSTLHTEKVSAALEIIEGTGSPVLISYRFLWEKEALLEGIPGARLVDEPGVIDEWNEGKVPVMLAHPASAGHGLNLQHGGHTIIWASMPNWDLELWEQFNARLARQGQANPVVVHMLLVPDSVDEAIRARLIDKASLQDSIMIALRRV